MLSWIEHEKSFITLGPEFWSEKEYAKLTLPFLVWQTFIKIGVNVTFDSAHDKTHNKTCN